jgi:hypothetical protein
MTGADKVSFSLLQHFLNERRCVVELTTTTKMLNHCSRLHPLSLARRPQA